MEPRDDSGTSMDRVVSIEDEVADVSAARPHVVLLGAGASKAALPEGDKRGRHPPLMREMGQILDLTALFPNELQELARHNFESAYSQLVLADPDGAEEVGARIGDYFADLELPDEPTLYDVLTLSLRHKDAIFTFNWDPLLLQSRIRLAKIGRTTSFPQLFFLHGNVLAGYCPTHQSSGLRGRQCKHCGEPFQPSSLLFPVEKKNYQDGGLVEREWNAAREFLRVCLILTVFGYSAPKTDVEAIALLREGWGEASTRSMEQMEIIRRPCSEDEPLPPAWQPFVHTHHFDLFGSFYDSWIAKHPRRSGEAYRSQYIDALFVTDNPVPRDCENLEALAEWFQPLFDAEPSPEPATTA